MKERNPTLYNNLVVNIVVCEDDKLQLELLAEFMEDTGFIKVVGLASSAEELYHVVTQLDQEVHGLVIDLHLGPGKDGLDIYSKLKDKGIQLPAILVTGNNPSADETYNAGLLDVIIKPYPIERLMRGLTKMYQHVKFQQFTKDGGKLVPINNKDMLMNIPPSHILYIDTDPGRNSKLNQLHVDYDIITTNIPLKRYEEYLLADDFFTINRALLVNIRRIKQINIEEKVIVFDTTETLHVIDEERLYDLQVEFRQYKLRRTERHFW